MRDIKKLLDTGTTIETRLQLIRTKIDPCAAELSKAPFENIGPCCRKYGRAAVAICVAVTLKDRAWRLDNWKFMWANEIEQELPRHGWTYSNTRNAIIRDEQCHPTRICEYAGDYIKAWTMEG